MSARASAPRPHERTRTDGPWTILRLLLWSAEYLEAKGVERARLDAEHLLAHVLGVGRLEMYLQHERPLARGELEAFRPLLRRRAAREPLQYVLGRQAFRDLVLEVGPGVLVPRPETEALVEVVLGWARAQGRNDLVGLDVGTGSGAIALALLDEGPFARFVGTDVSERALAVARRNRDTLGFEGRLELRAGADFEPVGGSERPEGHVSPGAGGGRSRGRERFDVVVSNPPYVAEPDRDLLAPEVVRWEPPEALFGGADGLAVLRRLVAGAHAVLCQGGLLALEVGDGQARAVVELLEGAGPYCRVRVHRDLAGKERIVTAERAPGGHG